MDINFELYKVFYHVAKTLSFSEAANNLYISQSAVSQSIKLLEKELGSNLFFRSTKNVRLTKEGEMLFNHIDQAFNFIKSGERTISDIHSMKQGEIRIAASDTICKYHVIPYLKKFIKTYPNIKIKITNRTSPKCIELLQRGSVDFSVVNLPNNLDKNVFNIQTTKTIRDVFIAGRSFQELKNRKIVLSELQKYPLLVLEKETVTRDFFDKLMKDKGINVKPEVELGSVDLLVQMTKIGLGISFVPEECVKSVNEDDIFILDIEEKAAERYLGAITLNSLPPSAAALKFLDMMK